MRKPKIIRKHSKRGINRFDWRTILLKNSGGISSKRVCGIIGWFVCIGILIASFIISKDVPSYGELIAITSASLLGLDSVTSIWTKQISENR
jgi:hypothetical protein